MEKVKETTLFADREPITAARVKQAADLGGFTPGNYIVLLRDHYAGNGDGEYFQVSELPTVAARLPFLFTDEERPIYAAIITAADVADIVAEKRRIMQEQAMVLFNMANGGGFVAVPQIDGRKTPRTAPELFEKRAVAVAANAKIRAQYERQLTKLRGVLFDLPYYPANLYRVSVPTTDGDK